MLRFWVRKRSSEPVCGPLIPYPRATVAHVASPDADGGQSEVAASGCLRSGLRRNAGPPGGRRHQLQPEAAKAVPRGAAPGRGPPDARLSCGPKPGQVLSRSRSQGRRSEEPRSGRTGLLNLGSADGLRSTRARVWGTRERPIGSKHSMGQSVPAPCKESPAGPVPERSFPLDPGVSRPVAWVGEPVADRQSFPTLCLLASSDVGKKKPRRCGERRGSGTRLKCACNVSTRCRLGLMLR